MKALLHAVAAAALLGTAPGKYEVDLSQYFASPAAEVQSRGVLLARAKAFIGSVTPRTAGSLRHWLGEFDGLLVLVQRHDDYVYLRAEENDADTLDAKADDSLGELQDRLSDRVVEAAQELGPTWIQRLARDGSLAGYRYLLESSLANATHRLSPTQAHAVDLTVTPVLEAAAASYKTLRKSPEPVAAHQDAYAALLISIAAARNGVARLRGFDGAAEASYFDKEIPSDSVERTLAAIRQSGAYARYLNIAGHGPKPESSPSPLTVDAAIPIIIAAEQPMGAQYAGAYAALLDPQHRRLEICTAPRCDQTGFSLGFVGLDSVLFFGGYNGSTGSARAVAHEAGHAVHREFMSRSQPIAAYNIGPAFMFESFAIFNELLFLDHLYATATNDRERAYYLNYFLRDATFQVVGSAEETDLESAIYRGVDAGTIRSASDLGTLTNKIFARYDPDSVRDSAAALYWARDRLFFTDPLYDVNYLFAGLLALRYFSDFERDPEAFSVRYVALLRNGFTDSPTVLERRFLRIDLGDEVGLVASSTAFIDRRTEMLSALYSSESQNR